MNSRALAADIIRACLDGDGQSHRMLRDCFSQHPELDARERAFITALVHGTLSEAVYLDACLDQFSRTPVRKMKPYVRAVLRMGLFQLYFMDRVPAPAVCPSFAMARCPSEKSRLTVMSETGTRGTVIAPSAFRSRARTRTSRSSTPPAMPP